MIDVGGVYRARAVDPGIPSALVLVTDVDDTTRSVAVMLLSPDIELGSSVGLLVAGDDIGRAYDVLVQSDIFGRLPAGQLDRRVAAVGPNVLDALSAMREDRAIDHAVAGPPVLTREDPRWDFKIEELRRFHLLTTAGV